MFCRFYVAFVIKRLLYIEFRVFIKKKNCWRCRNDPDGLLPVFGFGSRQRFSLSRQSFLALCRNMDLCVATWFPGCRGGWVAIGVFLVRDRVSFFWFFCRDRGRPCVATVFYSLSWQCRYRGSLVAAEMAKARGRGYDRSLAEAKEFRVATGNLLCCDMIPWGCVVT